MRDEERTAAGMAPGWRRLKGLPAALGALAGLALCALGYFGLTLFTPHTPDIMPTARAICADLSGQRYDDLYMRLAPALQTQGGAAQFAASQRELDQLQGVVTACAVTNIIVSGATASLTFTLTRAGARAPVSAQASLSAGGSVWRITAYGGAF